jgi:hypothetical protein
VRTRMMVLALVALAVPAAASAAPGPVTLRTSVPPGKSAGLTIGAVPRGEFVIALRASSDGAKNFTLTQRRNGGRRFTVLSPATTARACEGAAGSLFCTGLTTPATPAGHRWTFQLRNRSGRPIAFTLTIRWRAVASAG